ncbi:ABC transporter substrate-binding protein [Streptomyces sp. 4F14]|uniref:ABC transporter substrate-binding protein n=1 Tax=Streptomyces sp. 4F14 TaxID=3394380 RepID=UPI003A872E2D
MGDSVRPVAVSRRTAVAGLLTAALTASPHAVAAPGTRRAADGLEPLRVGVLLDTSGRGRVQGARQLLGVRHQAQMVNAAAGDLVELLVRDTRGRTAETRSLARHLVETDRVDALLGTSAPATAAVVGEIGQAAGVPVVMPAAGGRATQPYVFRSGAPIALTTTRMLQAIAQAGLRRVAAFSTESNSPPQAWDEMRQEMAGLGLELVDHKEFVPPADNLEAGLKPLIEAGPDVLAVFTTPPYNGIVARDARALGWSGPMYFSPAAGHPGFAETAGPAATGARVIAPWLLAHQQAPATLPNGYAVRAFAKSFEAAGHGPVGTYVGYGADALSLLHQAFYGHRDRVRARTELENMTHVGTTGVYRMSPDDHSGLDADALTVVEWRDGGWKPFTTASRQEGRSQARRP